MFRESELRSCRHGGAVPNFGILKSNHVRMHIRVLSICEQFSYVQFSQVFQLYPLFTLPCFHS